MCLENNGKKYVLLYRELVEEEIQTHKIW